LGAELGDGLAAYLGKSRDRALMFGEKLAGSAGARDRIRDRRDLLDVVADVSGVLCVGGRRF
jgi:hypothetical protein